MDCKLDFQEDVQTAPETGADSQRVLPATARAPVDLRAVRLDGTWQASSFDLARGLDVKVMHSKLSPETLDRLFRG